MRPRIYIDTSVIGGCEDPGYVEWSLRLLEEFAAGLKRPMISDLTRLEVAPAPEAVRAALARLEACDPEEVRLGEEAEALASAYLGEGAVSERHLVDAQHIAIASVERADVLVSWNFRHIVNLRRIRAYHAVNLKLGYPLVEIRSPREVLHDEGV